VVLEIIQTCRVHRLLFLFKKALGFFSTSLVAAGLDNDDGEALEPGREGEARRRSGTSTRPITKPRTTPKEDS
jgi:hypothetical protein